MKVVSCAVAFCFLLVIVSPAVMVAALPLPVIAGVSKSGEDPAVGRTTDTNLSSSNPDTGTNSDNATSPPVSLVDIAIQLGKLSAIFVSIPLGYIVHHHWSKRSDEGRINHPVLGPQPHVKMEWSLALSFGFGLLYAYVYPDANTPDWFKRSLLVFSVTVTYLSCSRAASVYKRGRKYVVLGACFVLAIRVVCSKILPLMLGDDSSSSLLLENRYNILFFRAGFFILETLDRLNREA